MKLLTLVRQMFCFNALAYLKQSQTTLQNINNTYNYYFKDKYTYWLILLLINQLANQIALQKQNNQKQNNK